MGCVLALSGESAGDGIDPDARKKDDTEQSVTFAIEPR